MIFCKHKNDVMIVENIILDMFMIGMSAVSL